MESYPGAGLTTEQLLDALCRRVEEQRSTYGHDIKNLGFRSMVRNRRFSLRRVLR